MTKRMLLGPAVRVIRDRTGIKHGAFALDIDITPGYLSNIEAGRKQPAPDVQVAIANRLGVALDAITYVIPSHP